MIATDCFAYCKVERDLRDLKKAGELTRDQLSAHSGKYDNASSRLAPNIWTYKTRKTKFFVCIDDFGFLCFSRDDANHIISALKQTHAITIDWTGNKFYDLNINKKYAERYVDISMSLHVRKALEKLFHLQPPSPPKKFQHAPHK